MVFDYGVMLAKTGERLIVRGPRPKLELNGRPQLFLPVRIEFQFRRQLESEISRCNVAAKYMTQVLRLAVRVRHSVEPA